MMMVSNCCKNAFVIFLLVACFFDITTSLSSSTINDVGGSMNKEMNNENAAPIFGLNIGIDDKEKFKQRITELSSTKKRKRIQMMNQQEQEYHQQQDQSLNNVNYHVNDIHSQQQHQHHQQHTISEFITNARNKRTLLQQKQEQEQKNQPNQQHKRKQQVMNDEELSLSFCDFFLDEFGSDAIFQELDCDCIESFDSFDISCINEDACYEHLEGTKSSYIGTLTFNINGIFTDPFEPDISDEICLDYNDLGTKGCIHNATFGVKPDNSCGVSVGNDLCTSCILCDPKENLLEFDCNNLPTTTLSANECNGESLEGTPIQFYSQDAQSCVSTTNPGDNGGNNEEPPEKIVDSYCELIEGEIEFDESLQCTCKEDDVTFEFLCEGSNLCLIVDGTDTTTSTDDESFTGDYTLLIKGDFRDIENPIITDTSCFEYDVSNKYNSGESVCLSDYLFTTSCYATVGSTVCNVCEVCDPVGKLNYECGTDRLDQCSPGGAPTLKATPFQFVHTEKCPEKQQPPPTPSPSSSATTTTTTFLGSSSIISNSLVSILLISSSMMMMTTMI